MNKKRQTNIFFKIKTGKSKTQIAFFSRAALFKSFAITFLSFAGAFIASFAEARVPASWIQGSGEQQFVAAEVDAKTEADQENSMVGDFDKIMHSNYAVINPSLEQKDKFFLASNNPKINDGPWYLASVKTEIGIGAGGEIGYVGVEGSSAVEYIWMRTARSTKKLQQEHYGKKSVAPKFVDETPQEQAQDRDTLVLSSDMKNTEVAGKVSGLVSYVKQTGKVRNIERMKSQMVQHLMYHQMLAKKISTTSQNLTWTPYKYQLELFVTAAGDVLPGVGFGGVVRVRMEWAIKQTNSLVSSSSAFSEHVEQLTAALSRAEIESNNSDNAYSLYAVKMGLGVGIGGDLDIVEAGAHTIASIFLKYNPPNAVLAQDKTQKTIYANNLMGAVSYSKWDFAIQKIVKMTNLISKQASRYEQKMDQTRPQRDFELGALEIELELSAGGEFFLPTVEGIAFMEVFYTKTNRLKP